MSSLKTSTLPKHNVFASRRYGCYPEKPVTVFACFLFSGLTTSFPASAGPTHNMWFVEMKQPTLKKGKRKTKAKAFRSLAQEKKRKHCIHQISRHTFFFFFYRNVSTEDLACTIQRTKATRAKSYACPHYKLSSSNHVHTLLKV